MSINNLPASLQSIIQQGYLERRFGTALRAKLGFRAIADRETFMAGVGESITKTRAGLLPAVTAVLSPPANSDITSGLTPQNWSVEQYTLVVNQYGANQQLNVVTSRVAIDDIFLENAKALGEQAARSLDTVAQSALFNVYMGGNTRVRVTLGTANATISVDDIRGFQTTWNSEGQPVPVSASNTVSVTVGSDVYTLTTATADGSNVSTAPGGISGTLTFSTSVTVADGTLGNAVTSAVAPLVYRPSTSGGVMAATTAAIASGSDVNSGKLTMNMILNAKATMSANSVQPVNATGNYIFYADPLQMTGLYTDPAFQFFFRGRPDSQEYRKGLIADILGVDIVETNINPVQALAGVGTVRRGVLCGQGALIEGVFTREGYAGTVGSQIDDTMITIVDDIAHITREPLDALKQVVTQTWNYIGGFAVPSDVTTNPNTIPTANNSAFKRAIIVESL